jgi:hypothetical protein
MIPVVMLGINSGAISSLFLTFSFCLAMTCPYFEHIPVIYLMTIVLRVIELFSHGNTQRIILLIYMLSITQVAHLAFSLLINIYATSIIALKAWCVHVCGVSEKQLVDFALIDLMTRTYRKYRKLLMESGIGIRTPTQAIKILALLIESGVIYILIGVSSALVYNHEFSHPVFFSF